MRGLPRDQIRQYGNAVSSPPLRGAQTPTIWPGPYAPRFPTNGVYRRGRPGAPCRCTAGVVCSRRSEGLPEFWCPVGMERALSRRLRGGGASVLRARVAEMVVPAPAGFTPARSPGRRRRRRRPRGRGVAPCPGSPSSSRYHHPRVCGVAPSSFARPLSITCRPAPAGLLYAGHQAGRDARVIPVPAGLLPHTDIRMRRSRIVPDPQGLLVRRPGRPRPRCVVLAPTRIALRTRPY